MAALVFYGSTHPMPGARFAHGLRCLPAVFVVAFVIWPAKLCQTTTNKHHGNPRQSIGQKRPKQFLGPVLVLKYRYTYLSENRAFAVDRLARGKCAILACVTASACHRGRCDSVMASFFVRLFAFNGCLMAIRMANQCFPKLQESLFGLAKRAVWPRRTARFALPDGMFGLALRSTRRF